jgi:hypothetical protein
MVAWLAALGAGGCPAAGGAVVEGEDVDTHCGWLIPGGCGGC